MRADAQINHDLLLEAAARAFAADGIDASLKAIAQQAGVGIGTLYRRFPTREMLVEAVYRSESAKLCEAAPELLTTMAPITALRAWMAGFLDYLATKRGMAGALHAVLTADDDLRMTTRGLLIDALAVLLAAGIADGSIRADADPGDVVMALGGIALIAGEPAQRGLAGRLTDLLVDGLRFSVN